MSDITDSVLFVVTITSSLYSGLQVVVLQPARSHGPIRFMLTSLPANLIGPCDLGG